LEPAACVWTSNVILLFAFPKCSSTVFTSSQSSWSNVPGMVESVPADSFVNAFCFRNRPDVALHLIFWPVRLVAPQM
jgi:hypothetical protein